MSKIETGRYSELLRRALGMKGQQAVAAELSPEVSPTWTLEGDDPEWQFLKGVRLVGGAAEVPAVAAEFGRCAVINPATSGMIGTIEGMDLTSTSVININVRLIQAELATFATVEESGPRDTRWVRGAGAAASAITFSSETNVAVIAGGFLVDSARVLASTSYRFRTPIVLAPGSTFFWGISDGTQAFLSSVWWKERAVPQLEL